MLGTGDKKETEADADVERAVRNDRTPEVVTNDGEEEREEIVTERATTEKRKHQQNYQAANGVTESSFDEILETYKRFRILCVGRSGVGKSSLINEIFGISGARVEANKPGDANIETEFSSPENTFFVLHDSIGFEPRANETFATVRRFILQRSQEHLETKDRLHAIWLCTQTPTAANGRIFEQGDEKLLQLAHEKKIPIVIVFTQYDKLVGTKVMQLRKKGNTKEGAQEQGRREADEAFKKCVESLKMIMMQLRLPLTEYAKVSVRPGYKGDVSALSETTCNLLRHVGHQLKGEAWMMWAVAQRASLPLRIEASVNKGISYYYQALSRAAPGVGGVLLRDCLDRVHQDIVTCWNFKYGDQILNSTEFKQLMLYIVQDAHPYKEPRSTTPELDRINQFVCLVTAAFPPIAPAASILGLSYIFVNWVSNAVLDRVPLIENVMMAYIIDLIWILKSLFDFTLSPQWVGTVQWDVLKDAFENYERDSDVRRIHESCRRASRGSLGREEFRMKIRELLPEV